MLECATAYTRFPYTTLFRSVPGYHYDGLSGDATGFYAAVRELIASVARLRAGAAALAHGGVEARSEEHTSELQSRVDIVCRLLLEKKKILRCITQVQLSADV